MSVEDRDPHTGYLTTGHEWNGITELNTPVPRVVYFFLIVTVAFSLGRRRSDERGAPDRAGPVRR
jgi:cytochrome c oxidase cbb3-type subunit 3